MHHLGPPREQQQNSSVLRHQLRGFHCGLRETEGENRVRGATGKPEGPNPCNQPRIRFPKAGELGDTLGDEISGMVVVDVGGHPLKYDCLTVLESIVAKQNCRVEIDVPREEGRGWRRTNSSFNTQELDEQCKHDWSFYSTTNNANTTEPRPALLM